MDDILEALYGCDIRFTPNQQLGKLTVAALDAIMKEEEKVKAELTPGHWTLVETYRNRVEDFHSLCAQAEFERGLTLGSQLMMEILLKDIGT